MEQLPETAREAGKAELGEPSEPRFRQKTKEKHLSGRKRRPSKKRRGRSIYLHSHVLFYLFDSEGGEDEKEATEEEEAEDTERTVSSAPMGNGAPARILIIVVQRVKLTL